MALLVAAVLVAPFAVLELVNAPGVQEGFPWVLFGFMFVNALLMAVSIAPPARRLLATRNVRTLEPTDWLLLALGVVLSWAYGAVLLDQLPCFLGVPNCD
jgi:hypothetical protein